MVPREGTDGGEEHLRQAWAEWYARTEHTTPAEPSETAEKKNLLSKTEKRRLRKKRKPTASPPIDRAPDKKGPPPPPPGAGGGDGGLDKGAVLTGLFQQALQALQGL